ncbi:MAG TPA: pyridoxamine 5'-phosphate oxidase family protein [Acidimicrobiales bacterium]|jgi:nitroimidazol reductase NimA-like FMN-containing flavoprotein (pyridoxamine 5'-phosphate oxidase superfamily)|nr:pyridoxamine 5'-phosphate oxidase family protein [Acidimicrobiales bacterium]
MTQRKLEELSPEECMALLGQCRVGRLVYQDDLGPAAVPVNYGLAGSDIVIRVEGGAKQAAMEQASLGFEVDHIDDDEHAGWSVLVRGSGHEVPRDLVPQLLHRVGERFPAPWASGVHNVWLQITPRVVTGRRLGPETTTPLS